MRFSYIVLVNPSSIPVENRSYASRIREEVLDRRLRLLKGGRHLRVAIRRNEFHHQPRLKVVTGSRLQGHGRGESLWSWDVFWSPNSYKVTSNPAIQRCSTPPRMVSTAATGTMVAQHTRCGWQRRSKIINLLRQGERGAGRTRLYQYQADQQEGPGRRKEHRGHLLLLGKTGNPGDL
eukprot:s4394_g6.t1